MFKITTLGVTAAVLATTMLTGCSSSSTAPSQEKTKADSGQPKAKLTMGSWRTEDKEAYGNIIKEFNKKYPNIEIDFSPTKNTEYNTVLNTALKTGGGPDIIHLRPYVAGRQLADANYLEPLDGVKGIEQFDKVTLSAATGTDGKVYGVPIMNNSVVIYYNKKLFNKLKLQEPKTWDELLKTAQTLKDNKIVPFAFGSKEGWILSLTHGAVGPVFYGGNDFVQKVTTGQSKFTSPEFVNSVQVMKDLSPYFPDNYVGISMDDMRNMFVTEQAGMMIMGDWEIAVMKKANPDLDMDVFPIPGKDGKPSVTTYVDGSLAVNSQSKNKAEAMKFIEFATTKEFGTALSNELIRSSTIQGAESKDPLIKKISGFSKSATPYMFNVYFAAGNPTSKSVFESLLQGLYVNKTTPAQVTEELQKSVDSWFKPVK